MTPPIKPQEPTASTTDTGTQPTAEWLTIYESNTVTASVLRRDGAVTRLLVKTPQTLPFSFAQQALRRWNTDPRRHFEVAKEEWVLTYKGDSTQSQYFATVETTFKDLEWTVIATEPGITVSVVAVEQDVTHVRIDWSPDADLEPEEAGTVCFADNALFEWNTVPGRRFQLDEAGWQAVEQETEDGRMRFETTVQTVFQTVLELYIDTPAPPRPDSLVQTVVTLLSQQLPDSVDYTSLFGSVQRLEYAPFMRVLHTYVDNGEYELEPETGWSQLPPDRAPVPLDVAATDNVVPHEPLDLDTTVELLVEQLKTFEDKDFSASKEGVTQQWAEHLAAYLIQSLIRPGRVFDGKLLKEGLSELISYYEHMHDQLVAEQEEAAAAQLWNEPEPTEP